jgi:diaminopimelate dehydrogenase
MTAVRNGECPTLSAREKHKRECYVVVADGADKAKIENEIKTMPNYFADYDTSVTFVTKEELLRDHAGLPHGGSVIRNGVTGIVGENKSTVEFSLRLDSNPEFTGSVLVAYARAIKRLYDRGERGARTVLDVAPADLSPLSPEELRRKLL